MSTEKRPDANGSSRTIPSTTTTTSVGAGRWLRRGDASGRSADDKTRRAYLLNAPALITIGVLIAYPIGYSFWISLQNYSLKQPQERRFVGFDNYLSLFEDATFRNSVLVSALFAIVVVVAVITLGLSLALVLNESFLGRGLLRSLALLPLAMPGVVNGLMWRWIFDPKVGALNGLLTDLGLIDEYKGWLIEPTSAFFLVAMAEVWNILPLTVIILLAGLTTVPSELYDAARVDCANVLQRFRNVTLPWLLHPLLICLILQTMNAFRAFDAIYVLTGGGPGDSTNLIALLSVRTVLTYTNFGLGNAYAYVITFITLIISIVYIRVLYRRGSVEL